MPWKIMSIGMREWAYQSLSMGLGISRTPVPDDRTHRVVSRVICDTYRDLSPQRRDLFCEEILGAGQPRH
jgi:hypothetical protein